MRKSIITSLKEYDYLNRRLTTSFPEIKDCLEKRNLESMRIAIFSLNEMRIRNCFTDKFAFEFIRFISNYLETIYLERQEELLTPIIKTINICSYLTPISEKLVEVMKKLKNSERYDSKLNAEIESFFKLI
jgi:hypothetical protein